MVDLRKKSFLKLLDFTEEEIRYLLDLAKNFKEKKHKHEAHEYLKCRFNIRKDFNKN